MPSRSQRGNAKQGCGPIVDIYSTFLQRSYDQIFQEVALQDLPVVFLLDRSGLTGPDGPTHHGLFDIGYLRVFPNMICMAPGYAGEMEPMLDFALSVDHPSSIRYPKASALELERMHSPIEIGKSEVVRPATDLATDMGQGVDGTIVAFGAILDQALEAADQLEGDLNIEVINARFVKPIDHEMVRRVVESGKFVITVEEGAMMGGFGSAFIESAVHQRLDTRMISNLALPDEFIQHGDRGDLLDQHCLSSSAIAQACRDQACLNPVCS